MSFCYYRVRDNRCYQSLFTAVCVYLHNPWLRFTVRRFAIPARQRYIVSKDAVAWSGTTRTRPIIAPNSNTVTASLAQGSGDGPSAKPPVAAIVPSPPLHFPPGIQANLVRMLAVLGLSVPETCAVMLSNHGGVATFSCPQALHALHHFTACDDWS